MFWNEGETRYSMTREACLFFTHSARCGEVQYWKRSQNATCLRVHYGELQFQCRAKTFFFCPKPEKPEKNQQNRAKTGWIILKTKKTQGSLSGCGLGACSWMQPWWRWARCLLLLPQARQVTFPSRHPSTSSRRPSTLCVWACWGGASEVLPPLPVGSRTSWWCRKAPAILSIIVRLHGWPPNSLFDFLLSYFLTFAFNTMRSLRCLE